VVAHLTAKAGHLTKPSSIGLLSLRPTSLRCRACPMRFPPMTNAPFPRADAVNEAGGRAYALSPRHALAQLAATGTLNGVYYASADSQLETLVALAEQVEPDYLARLAVYSRERAFMKDMPA